MESRGQNSPHEVNAEASLRTPSFDEEAEEVARPVVPLVGIDNAEAAARPARIPWAAIRPGRGAWPRSLVPALALAAGMAVGAAVVHRGTKQAAPSAAPQTSAEATAGAAGGPTLPEPVRTDVSGVSSGPPGGHQARREPSVTDEPEGRDRNEAERGERDEGKRAERERKEDERRRREDEKRAERGRKEAEKEGERQSRKIEKGVKPEARRVGVIIERSEP